MSESTVPKLDLAPKLNRPLSLWNPLDYLRLFYWVFFFPQAVRWYVARFCQSPNPAQQRGIIPWRDRLRQPVQRTLVLQAIITTGVGALTPAWLANAAGLSVDWFGVAGGVAGGVASMRPLEWILCSLVTPIAPRSSLPTFCRITPLPLPRLQQHLAAWLQADWNQAVYNLNQLLAYSLQFIPTIGAFNVVLQQSPRHELLQRVAVLTSPSFDRDLIRFGSVDLRNALIGGAITDIPFLPHR